MLQAPCHLQDAGPRAQEALKDAHSPGATRGSRQGGRALQGSLSSSMDSIRALWQMLPLPDLSFPICVSMSHTG